MIVVHLPFTADRTSGHHDSLDDTKTYRIIAKNKGEVLSLFLMIERTSTDSSGELDYTVHFTLRKNWNNNEKVDSQAQDDRSPIPTSLSRSSLSWSCLRGTGWVDILSRHLSYKKSL